MAGVTPVAGMPGWRYVLIGLAAALAVMSVFVAQQRSTPATTYGSTSAAAATADLAAGVGSIAAGCLALALGRRTILGVLMTLTGVAWLATDWIGWEDGPAVARSIAMVLAPFIGPMVLHLALAYPSGRVSGRAARALLAVAYGVTAVASVGLAVFRDPFRDLHCWANCTDNVFLVHADRKLARWFDGLGWWAVVVLGAAGAVGIVWRLLAATPVARRATWFVLVPAAVVLLAAATYGVAVLSDPSEGEMRSDLRVIFVLRASALAALATGFAWAALRSYRTAQAVTRLAARLGTAPAPGTFQASLADSLGDEHLTVAYWLNGARRYVDANGRPADPIPGRGQVTTTIVRGGLPLAVVAHDRALLAGHDLERDIGAAALLAVDNERLRAENLAQLEDLRASRTRIVAAADASRRRLERDLHDGAQQRLLAALYELRLAAATDGCGPALRTRVEQATELAGQTLGELREFAHGVYPAILVEAGLGPAVRTFADRAPISVEIIELVDERFPADIEAAAYSVVVETVADASQQSATAATVRIAEREAVLHVEVDHDGSPTSSHVALHLTDRVGALGGSLVLNGADLLAELPCAS